MSTSPKHERSRDASAAEHSTDEAVVLEGELEKQGGSHKNWKKRFFRLTASSISYFKTAKDKSAIRSLALSSVYVARNEHVDPKRPNCFVIFTTQRDFNLVVDPGSAADMNKWITGIRMCKEKVVGKQQLFGSDEPETEVVNNLLVQREIVFIEADKNRKIQEMIVDRLVQAHRQWTADLLKIVSAIREAHNSDRRAFLDELHRVRLECSQKALSMLTVLGDITEDCDSQLLMSAGKQLSRLKQLGTEVDARCSDLRMAHSAAAQSHEKHISALRTTYEAEMDVMRASLTKLRDDMMEDREKSRDKEVNTLTEKNMIEEVLVEKTMEVQQLQELHRSELEARERVFLSNLQSQERLYMLRKEIDVAKVRRECDKLRLKDAEERDRILVKARFGQDLSYDDGTLAEFYTGRTLSEAMQQIDALQGECTRLSEKLENTVLQTTAELNEVRTTATRKEAKMNEAVEAYKRQLDTTKNVYDGQVALLKDTFKSELHAHKDEIKRLNDVIASRDKVILDVKAKLVAAETCVAEYEKQKNVEIADLRANFELTLVNALADTTDSEVRLREALADKTHELTIVQMRKASEIETAKSDIERRVWTQVYERVDFLEKQNSELRAVLSQAKDVSAADVTNETFDYSTWLTRASENLAAAVASEEDEKKSGMKKSDSASSLQH
jgi:hypothetical protein